MSKIKNIALGVFTVSAVVGGISGVALTRSSIANAQINPSSISSPAPTSPKTDYTSNQKDLISKTANEKDEVGQDDTAEKAMEANMTPEQIAAKEKSEGQDQNEQGTDTENQQDDINGVDTSDVNMTK